LIRAVGQQVPKYDESGDEEPKKALHQKKDERRGTDLLESLHD
jgi:hypothetical protein